MFVKKTKSLIDTIASNNDSRQKIGLGTTSKKKTADLVTLSKKGGRGQEKGKI